MYRWLHLSQMDGVNKPLEVLSQIPESTLTKLSDDEECRTPDIPCKSTVMPICQTMASQLPGAQCGGHISMLITTRRGEI